MAITLGSASPIRWTGTGGIGSTFTSASFTPNAGELVVCCVSWQESSSLSPNFVYVTGGGLRWFEAIEAEFNSTGALAGASIWFAFSPTTAAMTITVTRSGSDAGVMRVSADALTLVGVDPDKPLGGKSRAIWNTNNLDLSVTCDGFGVLVGCATDSSASALPTSTDTEDAALYAELACLSVLDSTLNHSAGSNSINFNVVGPPTGSAVACEFKAFQSASVAWVRA